MIHALLPRQAFAAVLLCSLVSVAAVIGEEADNTITASIHVSSDGVPISPDLFGIFFEDINDAADGGLYAELVQNRSFEYSVRDNQAWDSLTAWSLVPEGDSTGTVSVETKRALHDNNPHYAVLRAERPGDVVSLRNAGFDGIPLVGGETYDVSLFARVQSGTPGPITVRLERVTGESLGEVQFDGVTDQWVKCAGTIVPRIDDANARLVVSTSGAGSLAIDMVSLFPQETFRNRPNGLRRDLAQIIADLKPSFVRFPGGCLAHGDGLENMYRWKETIGPVEQRRAQRNIWRYHQTLGLGYFEYFQFCEDIGAKPLPVVPAGVCCQNSGNYLNLVPRGQQGIPMDQMPAYVQEVLDLVEYANGPATSTWGAKRAEAGHPEPFHLEYLGVGNEDMITPVFKERFQMIRDAINAQHPEITVIGTTGPGTDGRDYEEGWKFANKHALAMVDEHGYKSPAWFWQNLLRFDSYDRSRSQVYLGEYAAHEPNRANTLRSALAEAAYMTALERNGDQVRLSSYAPLLSKVGRTQWRPDLIYFDNVSVTPSINYYAQQLFSVNHGDRYLPTEVTLARPERDGDRMRSDGIMLGTWNSQARFDDVRVVRGADTLLDESFDGSSPRWQVASGNWDVSDGTYSQHSDAEPALSRNAFADDGSGYTVTLRAMKTGGAEGFLIGFGAADTENYYWWNLGGWLNTMHAVERAEGGHKSVVGTTVSGSIEANRWYDIKIEVTSHRIRCYLDGKLIHDIRHDVRGATADVAAACVQDTASGDVILKIVSKASTPILATIDLQSLGHIGETAMKTVLAGPPTAENRHGYPAEVVPVTSHIPVSPNLELRLPPHSLTVIRLDGA